LAGHFAPGTLPYRDGHVGIVELGEGPTVGYLHGMLGNPGVHAVLEELAAAGHRVVAPSLPGFTGSSEPDGLRNLHDWVVATSEVVDVAGLAGAPLVASSVGAMLAVPLPVAESFGAWELAGGVQLLSLGGYLEALNDGDQTQVVGLFGISIGY